MIPVCSSPRIGCIGAAWCDYCGKPLVHRDARERLAALITRLTGRSHVDTAAR